MAYWKQRLALRWHAEKQEDLPQSPIFLEVCKWRQTVLSLCWATTPPHIKLQLTYNLRYIIKWELNLKGIVPPKLQTVSSIFTLCMTGRKIEVAWEQWEVVHLEKPLIYSINIKQVKKETLGVEFVKFLGDKGKNIVCFVVVVYDKYSLFT